MLGANGMSSDETESEGTPVRPKTVRRVAKSWLDNDVSEMWRDMERGTRIQEARAGNPGLIRQTLTGGGATRSAPVRGLPLNFYDRLWWTSLERKERLVLKRSAKATMDIPMIS